MHDIPRYQDLPTVEGAPPGSAWGVFGRDDQLGTLNFLTLTPERRRAAVSTVKRGDVFNLELPLHLPPRPFFANRKRPTHTIISMRGGGQDDTLDGFNTQYSSQWDGLRHARHAEHGFYNWTSDEDAHAEIGRLGMENFSRHGIVGRGVLLDLQRHLGGGLVANEFGGALVADEHRALPVSLLDEVARAQQVDIQHGDILLLRTGVAEWLKAQPEADEPSSNVASPGLEQGEATLAWLWDHQIAAVVSDNLAVEAFPWPRESKSLHQWGIALLGLVLGELFDLDDLAADCARDHIYECLFVSKPLLLRGGVGSPANALAMK